MKYGVGYPASKPGDQGNDDDDNSSCQGQAGIVLDFFKGLGIKFENPNNAIKHGSPPVFSTDNPTMKIGLRMKSIYSLIFTILFLDGCSLASNKSDDINPSMTPTLIPLAALDLESILTGPGNIPSGYASSEINQTLPRMFEGIPQPVNQVSQRLERFSDPAGGVNIMPYDRLSPATQAYDFIVSGFGNNSQINEIKELGERGQSWGYDYLFLSCNAVTHIRIIGAPDSNFVISYAKGLDQRLSKLVCR